MLHSLDVGLAVFQHQLGVHEGSVLEVGEDGTLDVLGAVVEVDEDGVDYIVEGGLRQFYVSAAEEDIYGCCYFEPDGVLRIV